MQNMPGFVDFINQYDMANHENCDDWEYHENCVFDCYNDQLNLFIENLPEDGKKSDYLKIVSELFPEDPAIRANQRCSRDSHTSNCIDPVGFFIGPARNSNLCNYQAYPPTVMMKVGRITDKTTLQDLVHSYQLYSDQKIGMSSLSYGGEDCDLTRTVFDVVNYSPVISNHYFSFPFCIANNNEESKGIERMKRHGSTSRTGISFSSAYFRHDYQRRAKIKLERKEFDKQDCLSTHKKAVKKLMICYQCRPRGRVCPECKVEYGRNQMLKNEGGDKSTRLLSNSWLSL